MANRRMFSLTIIDSDEFLDMALSTQALYFHLSMRADDDGFVNNPKKVMRMIGSSEDEMKILFAKKYILGFKSGVIVIRHWLLHNYIQKDRYKGTVYTEEKQQLILEKNNVYTLDTERILNGDTGKVSIDKNNIYSAKSKDIPAEYIKLAEKFYSNKKSDPNYSNHSALRNVNLQIWANELYKLSRINKYSFQEIVEVLEFSINDKFWSRQIISLAALRNKSGNGSLKFENVLNAMQSKQQTSFRPNKIELLEEKTIKKMKEAGIDENFA